MEIREFKLREKSPNLKFAKIHSRENYQIYSIWFWMQKYSL